MLNCFELLVVGAGLASCMEEIPQCVVRYWMQEISWLQCIKPRRLLLYNHQAVISVSYPADCGWELINIPIFYPCYYSFRSLWWRYSNNLVQKFARLRHLESLFNPLQARAGLFSSSVLPLLAHFPSATWETTLFTIDYSQDYGSAFIWSGSGSSILGWISIRIQIRSWSRVLMAKNWKKIPAEKKLNLCLIKNYNWPIPRPRTSKLQKKAAFISRKRTSSTSKHEIY